MEVEIKLSQKVQTTSHLQEDPKIWWAKRNSDGTFTVDTSKLLFSLILDELAIVEAIHNVDDEGNITSKEDLIEIWKAKVQNLRKIPKITVVRASYHLFYKPVKNEYPWRQGWKLAWAHTNYLFTVNLDEVWNGSALEEGVGA